MSNSVLVAAGVLCSVLSLSASTLLSAAELASGWRGSGTGKYPQAHPPTTWERISPAMLGLRFCAAQPATDQAGTPMSDGVIREWLVLGPIPAPKDGGKDKEVLPAEAQLAPREGQQTGPATWKKVTLDSAYLDFSKLCGKAGESVAFAYTHIYSPTAGSFRVNLTSVGDVCLYVNGKKSPPFGVRCKLDLVAGWNRILLRVAPGENDWYAVPVVHAWGGATYRDTNIAWRTPLPGAHPGFYGGGGGVGAPVIVRDKLYLLSEPSDLICLNKSDGKVQWLRRCSYFEAATDEDKKHPAYQEAQAVAAKLDALNTAFVAGTASAEKLQEKLQLEKDLQKQMKRIDSERFAAGVAPDVGFSGFTPSTDGEFLYLWFATGVTACYDLDGNRRWMSVDRLPAVEHGFSSSPVLADGKFVVFMRDLLAFQARTGSLAWRIPVVDHEGLNPGGFFHGSLAATTIGGVPVVVLGNGALVRAADGRVLRTNPGMGNQSVASPVLEGRRLVQVSSVTMEFFEHTLPAELSEPLATTTKRLPIDTTAFPKHYLPWVLSSPVIHEGLAYLLNNAGVLTVIDCEAGRIVYQKLLDLDVCQGHNEGAARGVGSSLALAGGRLYLFGNNGAALVIEPGRTYRQVAKNKLENVVLLGHWAERQERFMANPVFEGPRLFIRGEESLYALGP